MKIKDLINLIAEYEIVHVDFPDDVDFSGEIDYKRKKIYINKNLLISERKLTLLHEFGHAYRRMADLETDNNKTEEREAEKLAREFRDKYL